MKFIATLAVTALVAVNETFALENGLGRVPQMGWNTWNKFACNISEELIKETIKTMQDLNLTKLGYTYMNLDDCWMEKERDGSGFQVADSVRFP